ncbi:type VII toxin-antitoxin system MntA family adenylyltransferase antitoxin [Thalassolituus sp. UBA2590]|uniref:type VII toxin-antitoxin system MntA family adenylyltransferase antitoxin n=1 Tax=Thalassolituus sp. UBA2590 TaxID=1947663 RepID=UPI0026492349|nr:nucleotidyltransferase domain-containing protein [Thalassolituus sp. UBA2590]|tara:strand:+ start:894 stop:1295 length:402 start_codon:yes stop_codon:yes gene_type:complete
MGKFDQLLPDIIKLANATDEVDTLYLYGSHAKGSAQENSDIDLAVIFKNTDIDVVARRLRPEILAIDWANKLELPEGSLSLLDLGNGPVPLAMSVLKTGKLLVNKNPAHEFEVSGKIMSKWEIDHLHHYQQFG